MASNDARAYVAAGHAVRLHDTLDHLGGIRPPTLVIAGELDAGTPVAMSQAMADCIPGARLVVMPGLAHLSALEQPVAFGDALEDFLRSAAPAPR